MKGYSLPTNHALNIFQFSTSFLVFNNKHFDCILHIPVRNINQEMTLHKLTSLSFLIPGTEKSLRIQSDNAAYIATNPSRSQILEINKDDLDSCSMIGSTYFYDNLIQRQRIDENSCVIAIFRGKSAISRLYLQKKTLFEWVSPLTYLRLHKELLSPVNTYKKKTRKYIPFN